MRLLTLTSDNFVDCTALMLESLRVWHPDVEVVVYALDTGWAADHAATLSRFDVELRLIAESDPRHRGGADGRAIQNVHKMDIFLEQQQPFLFLDSDILVLGRLDGLLERIAAQGWATVQEGTPLCAYYQGDITRAVDLGRIDGKLKSINTGVLGCDPARHRDIFEIGASWIGSITGIRSGDQGLINLAWYKRHGCVPESAGNVYNGGWTGDDRIRLTQKIVHFARPNYPPAGRSKAEDQRAIWQAWPRGITLTALTATDFWQRSLPHPWPWTNQCDRKPWRDAVTTLRRDSLALLDGGCEGLIVENAHQAYLLDSRVLEAVAAWWRREAERFAGLRHVPTYHLCEGGRVPGAWGQRLERTWMALRSRVR